MRLILKRWRSDKRQDLLLDQWNFRGAISHSKRSSWTNWIQCNSIIEKKNSQIFIFLIGENLIKFIGKTTWKGLNADQWQSIQNEGDKKNTYTFYINSVTGAPLYYEMFGYDSLLGSHYDKYYVEYFNFNTDEIDPSVFAINSST